MDKQVLDVTFQIVDALIRAGVTLGTNAQEASNVTQAVYGTLESVKTAIDLDHQMHVASQKTLSYDEGFCDGYAKGGADIENDYEDIGYDILGPYSRDLDVEEEEAQPSFEQFGQYSVKYDGHHWWDVFYKDVIDDCFETRSEAVDYIAAQKLATYGLVDGA